MKTILWASDIHLDHAKEKIYSFIGDVNSRRADVLLVTGDISRSSLLETHLKALRAGILPSTRMMFVLGNHDYWEGSVKTTQDTAESLSTNDLLYLTLESGGVAISPSTWIVGVDGWYDARCDSPLSSNIIMNDWRFISEYVQCAWDTKAIVATIQRQADEQTRLLERHIEQALKMNDNLKSLIVATHVPPFVEAAEAKARAAGRANDASYGPWYVNRAMGTSLENIANDTPNVDFTVLSGHVHVGTEVRKKENLTYKSAAASYKNPAISGCFSVD